MCNLNKLELEGDQMDHNDHSDDPVGPNSL